MSKRSDSRIENLSVLHSTECNISKDFFVSVDHFLNVLVSQNSFNGGPIHSFHFFAAFCNLSLVINYFESTSGTDPNFYSVMAAVQSLATVIQWFSGSIFGSVRGRKF